MPDILRILPSGGDYRDFQFPLASGETKIIGNIYRERETYGVIFNASNTPSLQDFNSSGSIIGTVINVAGVILVFIYHAEKIMLPKLMATGEACWPGDNLYLCLATWRVSPNYVTGRVKIGICVEAATDTAARVQADLKGERPEPELLT